MTLIKAALIVALIFLNSLVFAQNDSPYKLNPKADGAAIVGGIGLSYLGLQLIKNKKGLSPQEMAALRAEEVNFLDRPSAGNYSENADKVSYYPFFASFVMPAAILLNKQVGRNAGQVMLLYVETMALTGTVYTLTAGTVRRYRPLVYSPAAPLSEKTKNSATRSFFAGHTAATAAATFFAAKVFHDFNPNSKAKPYVWAAAALAPATVAYLRYKAGMHFLTDNIIGYAVGAGAGILVPELHKKMPALSLTPQVSPYYRGIAFRYQF